MNRLRIVLLVLMALSTGCESDEQHETADLTLASDDMSDGWCDDGCDVVLVVDDAAGASNQPSPPELWESKSTSLTFHPLPSLKNPRVSTVMSPKTIAIQPSVAFGEDGGLGLAWCGMTDDNLGIFFVVYGPDETPMGEPVVANTTEEGIQNEPSVCRLKGGGYVVAWSQDSQGDAPNLERYRFDPRGRPLDTADQVVTTGVPSNHWLTHLACDDRGGFAVTGVFGEWNIRCFCPAV